MLNRLGLFALHQMDPERAHGLAIRALKSGFVPAAKVQPSARLRGTLAGLTLASPLGIAAGFDKNAEVAQPLARAGFGWIEVGAATPRPQPGNPKPRLFRLSEDRAAINRFGFNNDGMEMIAKRMAGYQGDAPLGLNLGANKDSDDRAADYATVLSHCGKHLDFATVNISSPNTERLRDLQGAEALEALLDGVMTARAGLARSVPIFLKIAPDLTDAELEDIATVASKSGVDAIIATNTTIDRTGLRSHHAAQKGGLSGAPLFDPSTRVLARLSSMTAIPLVGVGGISNADQAYAKIRAGASAIQLYTALIYRGMALVDEITEGLDRLLARDGYDSLAQAVGTDRIRWLT